jgi:hypothetical protein
MSFADGPLVRVRSFGMSTVTSAARRRPAHHRGDRIGHDVGRSVAEEAVLESADAEEFTATAAPEQAVRPRRDAAASRGRARRRRLVITRMILIYITSVHRPSSVVPRGTMVAMRARDLAGAAPFVRSNDDALDALTILTTAGLPGVVVRDGDGFAVIPASQVLRVLLPQYVLDDPRSHVCGTRHPPTGSPNGCRVGGSPTW